MLTTAFTFTTQKPLRLIAVACAVFSVFLVFLVATTPNGSIPSIAKSSVIEGRVVIEFHPGDRYFWLPAGTKEPVSVAEFTASIPGSQSITQRSSYSSTARLAFDEDVGGPDKFTLQPNYLYAVAGVFTDAKVSYPVAQGTAGKSFLNDIKANSNAVTKRMWSFVASAPGLMWDDLQHIGSDMRDLFSAHPQSGHAARSIHGGVQDFVSRVQSHWVTLLGFAIVVITAPFLGVPAWVTGAVVGLLLGSGGFWVLGLLAVLAGFAVDGFEFFPKGREVATRGIVRGFEVGQDYPKLIAGMGLFVASLAIAMVLSYLDHDNLAALVVLAGAIVGVFMVYEATKGGNVRRNWMAPSLVGFALVGVATGSLFYLGYVGLAWGLFIFLGLLIVLFAHRAFRNEETKLLAAGRRGAGGVVAFHQDLSRLSKVTLWVALGLTWLTVSGFVDGDVLRGVTFLLVTLVILTFILGFVVPRELAKRDEERTGPLIGLNAMEE